jgi:ectoine hydroxylase-related dioxygenase (phytanoyl-CoA dioxygenase family)
VANPGPMVLRPGLGTKEEHFIDNANPGARQMYFDLLRDLPVGEFLADAWDSEHIWFMSEEIYYKEGEVGRTFWHQDTSYEPWGGDHWGTMWITLDELPLGNGLEIVRGSHRGTRYDGAAVITPEDDPTTPFWGDRANPPLPRLPNVEAERAKDPNSWDILSWNHNVGDVLILHPGSLHGGAPVDARTPRRRGLNLRFFGDKAYYRGFGEDGNAVGLFTHEQYAEDGRDFRRHLKEGDLWRDPEALQLR